MTSEMALEVTKQEEFTMKMKRLKRKKQEKSDLTRGVIYLGHLPDGFVEKDMKAYFKQFGKVTRLRLARSRKTGKSCGYAFVEFQCDEVAKVVAESMNNYLLHEKLLKCKFIPSEELKPDLFKGWKVGRELTYVGNRRRNNSLKQTTHLLKLNEDRIKRLRKTEKRLAEMGISFHFPSQLSTTTVSTNVTLPNQTLEKPTESPTKKTTADNSFRYSVIVDSSEEEVSLKTPPNTRKTKKIKSKKTTKNVKVAYKTKREAKVPSTTLNEAKVAGRKQRKNTIRRETF